MTTDIMLAIALGASIILNAMQASKAQEWRNKVKHKDEVIDHLTRPLEEEKDAGMTVRHHTDGDQSPQEHRDWLAAHPGVTPKPGYERKRR